jgi:hypothetical protein
VQSQSQRRAVSVSDSCNALPTQYKWVDGYFKASHTRKRRTLHWSRNVVIVRWGDTITRTFGCRYTCRGSKAKQKLARTHRTSLERTFRMERGLRKADLLEYFEYFVIPEGILCADRIGKDVCSPKVQRKDTYYV